MVDKPNPIKMMLNITPPKYSMQGTIDSPQTSVPKPSAFK
jgi:hypothetical protein